jgi:hypothetical protein
MVMSDGIREQPPAEDDLDRALRELSEGIAGEAKFKELSAKERAKAAKSASKQARKRLKAREAPAPSVGWRGGYRYDLPARELRKQGRRARRRRALKATSWIVSIAVLAGAGVFAYQHFAAKHGGLAAVQNAPGLSPAGRPAGPPADPFANTPADKWADGAAGIVVPTAKAVGPFTTSQVAAAYETTKKLLISQDLDRSTLLGGPPTAFEDVLPTQERQEFVAALNEKGQHDGSPRSSRAWVASFAPGTTALIGNVIKVHGTMSARVGTSQGQTQLFVDVDYRFVYAVEPPHDPAEWMRVVGQESGYEGFNNLQDPSGPLELWFNAVPSEAGTLCDSTDGYSRPQYADSRPDTVQPSGPAIDPYSMNNPKPSNGCGLTTGT